VTTTKTSNKKDYQTVLTILASHATITSYINKFAKTWATTEDSKLKNYLGTLISHLKQAARGQTKPNQVLSLRLTEEPYKSIAVYCNACLQSEKPQWQIIAEQHGWGPRP
jgi:hypothetical protein